MENKFHAKRGPASDKRNYANTKSTLQATARKAVVEENDKAREGWTAREQLEKLDRQFGKGQGARKERARLADKASREEAR